MNRIPMKDMTRRDFTRFCGGAFAAALMARPQTLLAVEQSSAPLTLNIEQWQTVAAMCNQILPTIDGLGANEANCVNFIDKALAHEEKKSLALYQRGLQITDAFAQTRWQKSFAALNDAQQIQTLEMLEDGVLPEWSSVDQQTWFATLRFHTLLGFAAAPRFGGNQNLAGWRAMNFPGHVHEMGGLSDAQVEGVEPIPIHFPH